ncbi:ABC transporter ATP-binding protein [Actinoallomurus rhizosphaericola]|uniref:ABC transporter ATP-binding protein n=1 Tax=Actinoallomurus rhizosphaericola TaxID=2952536 RepID=UPI002093F385|nr:ABC transporter ATP-binding protein [Actinoallomurus rhizosphaericola]MCO5998003.1 ABC transporter ATP-binding protein [Actinoallomurus rhizosphaericola]
MPGSVSPTVTTAAAISAVGLSRRYGEGPAAVHALREVDLTVPANSFTAIMGPSGSGKSTLLHCLSGLDTATGGQVFHGDVEITRMSERELTRLRRERVGFVFQEFNLLPTLTARENVLLPLQLAGRRPDPGLLETIIGLLGLAERLEHRPAELSGGQIQRVAVARALVTEPRVVFADEPTGNLDRRSGTELLRLLRRCVGELGQTVVMVTHDPAAAAYADRVLFLADGRFAGDLAGPTLPAILDRLDALEDDLGGNGAER